MPNQVGIITKLTRNKLCTDYYTPERDNCSGYVFKTNHKTTKAFATFSLPRTAFLLVIKSFSRWLHGNMFRTSGWLVFKATVCAKTKFIKSTPQIICQHAYHIISRSSLSYAITYARTWILLKLVK